ncbi:PH domain-containing protein [Saccharibacter sp. 17.LH.SD]|uniref:PH domain-containing protein n=1 Tax=Saccharibacter sp. 17.LH.SD TaxID=2689393 RepID=UPI001F3BA9C4|nr:PH domain-containing protein [Saccharibacter sp. 17.LH.SD]
MIYLIIRYITTEIVVSNKRFIVKSGWISRSVSEVSISRIEGVSLKQGIVGRLFRYGSVIVRGTGGNLIVVPIVHDPMALQSTLQNMISAYGSKS